jgi:hypothetical protein
MKRKQKNQIEERLEAEAASESRGYVRPRKAGATVKKVVKMEPRRWSPPRKDVEVRPLASLGELLDVAKPEEGPTS